MRNLLLGLAVLIAGAYALSNDGKLRFPTSGGGASSGNISGYLGAPSSSLGSTKSAADRILK